MSVAKRASIAIIVVLVAAMLITAILLAVAKGGRHWPEISDPQALVTAAQNLAQEQGKEGVVPRDRWPAEVVALKPNNVAVSKGYLWIWTAGGGISNQWGYRVYFDASKVGSYPKSVHGSSGSLEQQW
jgi:hypothetical protein